MTHQPRSLIERAAEVYDFRAAMRNPPLPDGERVGERASAAEAGRSEPQRRVPSPNPLPAGRGLSVVDRDALSEAGFVLPDAPASGLAEEFRIVKRQLLLGAFGGQAVERGRVMLVCSAQPNEGKTFCAVNLALSMANEKDIETLLVDADFAKPEVLSTLGLPGGPGLIDAIADPGLDVESCVIRTDIPRLSVLAAGSQSNEATELLASERTRAVLERLSARPNRVIIFDSPPALAASPAAVLAAHAGQLMMVVKADQTSEAELREAIGVLDACAHVRLLLNGAAFAPNGRRYGSYYGYGV